MRDIKLIWPMPLPISRALFCFALSVLNIVGIYSQEGDAYGPLELDPSIRHGRLSNGLTYYIKHVDNPGDKLLMRFYVKTGDYNETPEQLDFAHAIEHLAFKCAEHFTGNLGYSPEMLSRLGMDEFDVYGRTSINYTLYYFDVPHNRKDAFDTGLQWFQDISDLQLTPDVINKERGPLRQEKIMKQGSNLKEYFVRTLLESKIMPCKKDNSNFFEHNRSFDPKQLMRFYKKWYRPNRMSLVVIGDTTRIDGIESGVKERFSNLKSGKSPILADNCMDEYLDRPNQFVVLEQPSVAEGSNRSYVKIYLYMRDGKILGQNDTWAGLKREVVWNMLGSMINRRFKMVDNDYNSTFTASGMPPHLAFPAYRIQIQETPDNTQEAVRKVIGLLQQLKKYGFNEKEWKLQKNKNIKGMEPAAADNPKYWIEQIQKNYVYGSAVPEHRAIVLYQWLLDLTLDEFNTLLQEYISITPNDIAVVAPAEEKFTEEEVRAWIRREQNRPILPFVSRNMPGQWMDKQEVSKLPPVPLEYIGKSGFGAKEFVLGNGAKVVLFNSQDFSKGHKSQIFLHGFSPKGASCFTRADYFSAINAPPIVQNSGLGEMDKFQIHGLLDGTSMRNDLFSYVDYRETGIKGNASLQDIEKLLQLVYLHFAKPRKDGRAFDDWKLMESKKHGSKPSYDPIVEDFNVAVREFIGDSSLVPKGTRRWSGISKTDLNRSYEIYNQLYGDPSDFTFLISGDFSANAILPMIQKYLGNIPNSGAVPTCGPEMIRNVNLPMGPLYTEFSARELGALYEMKSVKYSLKFISKAQDPLDWQEHIKMEILGALISSRSKKLRFTDEAGLYDVYAITSFNRELSSYELTIYLDCMDKDLKDIRKLCKELIREVRKNSFYPERLEEVIQNKTDQYRAVAGNAYMELEKMHGYYRFQEPWLSPSEVENYLKSLKIEDIKEAADKYLRDENMMEFVLRNGHIDP